MMNVGKVKIGPFKYTVALARDLHDNGRALDGQIIHARSLILLDDALEAQASAQTLLHEIVHAIGIQAGLELNERQVDSLAFGFMGVMKENPSLVKLICVELDKNDQ
jgi:hypothetical protein